MDISLYSVIVFNGLMKLKNLSQILDVSHMQVKNNI